MAYRGDRAHEGRDRRGPHAAGGRPQERLPRAQHGFDGAAAAAGGPLRDSAQVEHRAAGQRCQAAIGGIQGRGPRALAYAVRQRRDADPAFSSDKQQQHPVSNSAIQKGKDAGNVRVTGSFPLGVTPLIAAGAGLKGSCTAEPILALMTRSADAARTLLL